MGLETLASVENNSLSAHCSVGIQRRDVVSDERVQVVSMRLWDAAVDRPHIYTLELTDSQG